MGNSFGGAVKLSGENEYKRALSTITSQLKVLGAETKLVSAQYKNNDNAAKSMTAQNEALGNELKKQNELTGTYKKALRDLYEEQKKSVVAHEKLGEELEEQKKKLENLKSSGSATSEEIKKQEKTVKDLQSAYDKSGKQIDTNENKINSWTQKLIKSKADAQNLTNKIDDNKKSMEKAASVTETSTDNIDKFADSEDKAGKKAISFGDLIKANVISSAITSGLSKIADLAKSVAKGFGSIVSDGISGFADYEQNIGGVETLFKKSKDVVVGYANDAYKTAGLSANEYMETVTSFSASLLQSLDGDTAKAAKAANTAVTDMADNANKFGTDMQSIQNAYQGFAKQNYSMLDNLKLGYGGTQKEMYRLMQDAQKLDSTFDADFSLDEKGHLEADFADITKAIHIVQTNMGVTGTTSKEASTTIQGSVSSMKSAWQNFTTGMGDPSQNFSQLTGNLVDSVKTVVKNFVPLLKNLLPTIVNGISSVAKQLGKELPKVAKDLLPAISEVISSLADMIVNTLPEILPTIATTGITVLQTLIDGIVQALPLLIPAVVDIVTNIANLIVDNLPKIIEAGIKVIVSIAQGIAQSLPKLIPSIVKAVIQMAQTLIDNLDMIIDAALDIIMALADGLIKALPQLIKALPKIIISLVNGLLNNLPKLTECAIELMIALSLGLIEAIPELIKAVPKIIVGLVKALAEAVPKMLNKGKELVGKLGEGLKTGLSKIAEIGSDLVKGLWNGIKDVTGWVMDKIKGFGQDILDGIKSFFGIHSPSRVMRDQVGAMIGHGIAIGIEKSKAKVNSAMTNIAKTIVEDGRKAFDKLSTALDKVTEKHKTSLETLKSSYKQTVTEIKNAQNSMAEKFIGFSDLFNGGKQNETVSAADILKNQRETTEQYENFQKQLDLLRKKGLSESLLDQFADMGVGYANQLEELNKLSTAELKQYQAELSKQKVISNNIAKKQFATELNDAQSEYKASIAKADKEYKKSYNKLVNNSQKYMKSVGKAIKKGLQDGSKMSTKEASKTADNIVGDLVKQIKKKMKINSPSRVMKDEVGVYLAQGVGVGFTDEMKAVKNTMSNAIPRTFGVKSDVDTAIVHSYARISAVRNNDTDKFNVVTAIKEAFNGLNVVLDDEKVGRFVIDTVGKEVYS